MSKADKFYNVSLLHFPPPIVAAPLDVYANSYVNQSHNHKIIFCAYYYGNIFEIIWQNSFKFQENI